MLIASYVCEIYERTHSTGASRLIESTGIGSYSMAAVGLVGALDLGVAWHPESRAWSLGTGATAAPTYMRFCNATWCLREWTMLWGGEVHASGRVTEDAEGRGVSWTMSMRALRGAPTAWIYPRLTLEQKNIPPWAIMIGGLATYRW